MKPQQATNVSVHNPSNVEAHFCIVYDPAREPAYRSVAPGETLRVDVQHGYEIRDADPSLVVTSVRYGPYECLFQPMSIASFITAIEFAPSDTLFVTWSPVERHDEKRRKVR